MEPEKKRALVKALRNIYAYCHQNTKAIDSISRPHCSDDCILYQRNHEHCPLYSCYDLDEKLKLEEIEDTVEARTALLSAAKVASFCGAREPSKTDHTLWHCPDCFLAKLNTSMVSGRIPCPSCPLHLCRETRDELAAWYEAIYHINPVKAHNSRLGLLLMRANKESKEICKK